MCPLVVAEWDKDNLLTHEIGTTFEPHTWDRASKIDMKLAEACFEEIEKSDYIEFALHGVLHGNYDENGNQITEMEYFEHHSPDDKRLYCMPEEEILRRIDLFYKIYNSWGFTKKIRSYAAPNGFPSGVEFDDLQPMISAFNKHGIRYWANYWKGKEINGKYLDGILYMIKSNAVMIPWNAYDFDPAYLRDFVVEGDTQVDSVLGMHWPNFLKFQPENNMSVVPKWVAYFKKQAEIFGVMISKDIAFSGNQHIYRDLAKITYGEKSISINLEDVFNQKSLIPDNEFYISVKNGLYPISGKGCTFEEYEKHNEFTTYKISHTARQIEIDFQ